MGCADPPSKGSSKGGRQHPISVLSESVPSYLCYLMLTCTHSNDATHSCRYSCVSQGKDSGLVPADCVEMAVDIIENAV